MKTKRGSLTRKAVFSSGGVVYRGEREGIEIVICGRTREGLWALPKGSPMDGETPSETALREVQEETGLSVMIEGNLGSIRYQFSAPDGTEFDKTVEHYLMKSVSGNLADHDAEFDAVRWAPVDDALRLMRYENEREIVRRAVKLIQERTRL